jgi:hypothetical protein
MFLAASSCTGLVGFNITRPIPEQTVPGDPTAHALAQLVPDQSPIHPFEVSIDLTSESRSNGNVPVQRVFLRALSFTITPTAQPAGDQDCWDFVDTITLSAESTRPGTALPPVTVATGSQPGCVQVFALTVMSDVNIKPYIDEGLRVTATGSGIPPADDVSFVGSVTVRAEPF